MPSITPFYAAPRSVAPRSSALTLLLARYVSGQFSRQAWTQLMTLLDLNDMTAQERLALAMFFDDVMDEADQGSLKVPAIEEAEALLTEIRMA